MHAFELLALILHLCSKTPDARTEAQAHSAELVVGDGPAEVVVEDTGSVAEEAVGSVERLAEIAAAV